MVLLQEFEAKTGGRLDALDITDEVLETVADAGVSAGNVLVFSPHTTCCVVIAAAGTTTTAMLERLMEALAPAAAYYAHDDFDIRTENLVEDEPPNAPSHIFQVFAGKVSECIPIVGGVPALGDGQRVLFVELDASRLRRYVIQVVGE